MKQNSSEITTTASKVNLSRRRNFKIRKSNLIKYIQITARLKFYNKDSAKERNLTFSAKKKKTHILPLTCYRRLVKPTGVTHTSCACGMPQYINIILERNTNSLGRC